MAADAENSLDRRTVEPAGRARVPAPAAPTAIGTVPIDVGCHHIGLDTVGICGRAVAGMVDRVEDLEALPGLVAAFPLGECQHDPDGRMRVLPAVVANTRRIGLDIARILAGLLEGRGE